MMYFCEILRAGTKGGGYHVRPMIPFLSREKLMGAFSKAVVSFGILQLLIFQSPFSLRGMITLVLHCCLAFSWGLLSFCCRSISLSFDALWTIANGKRVSLFDCPLSYPLVSVYARAHFPLDKPQVGPIIDC